MAEDDGEYGGVDKRAWNSGFAGGMGKRAWNSGFAGGMGKRAWNSGFTGGMGKRAWNSGFTGQSSGSSIQGDPSACGKGYVDISSDSYRGYPETVLMST